MIYGENDYPKENIKYPPFIPAMLCAVESRFYQNPNFSKSILGLGTGDGRFAKSTFTHNIDCRVDPGFLTLRDAKKVTKYDLLINANGEKKPRPDKYFHAVFSNSVLEHIPNVDSVLKELFRVTKPNAFFYVPNQIYTKCLSITRHLDTLKIERLPKVYRQFFNRISRHYHYLSPIEWESKFTVTGFNILEYWNYFSSYALATLEWVNYLGLPYSISKKYLVSGSIA